MRLLVSSKPKILPSLLPDFAPWLGTLVTPTNGQLKQAISLGLPWACDNDCFQGLDESAYRRMLANVRGKAGCLWVSVPDVVGDARATMAMFSVWRDEVSLAGHPLALVGQDGAEDLDIPWGEFGAWFIGGTTRWKLSQASASLASEAISRGKTVHMGRANTYRRYVAASDMGCHTLDGTNVCKWPDVWMPKCVRWLRSMDQQAVLFAD